MTQQYQVNLSNLLNLATRLISFAIITKNWLLLIKCTHCCVQTYFVKI